MSRRPVDLSFGNSIIGAFAQGRAEALERLRNKQVQEQLAVENEQKRQAAEEDRRQFEAQMKAEQIHNDAVLALQRSNYELNKAGTQVGIEEKLRGIIQAGGTPSGMSKVNLPGLDEQVRQMPTIFGEPAYEQELSIFRRNAGQSDLLPEQIVERNPDAVKREVALLEQRKADLAQQRTQENELYKSKLISAEKEAELKQNLTLRREEMAKDLQIARINAAAKAASDKPVSGLAQAVLNNPPLLWTKEAMTPTERGKVLGELSQLGYNPLAQTQEVMQKTSKTALDIISDIKTDKKFTIGGAANIKVQAPGSSYLFPDEFTSLKKLERLVNVLTVPELSSVTLYPISDPDREFLKSLPTFLHYGLPKAEFTQELNRLEGLLKTIQSTPLSGSPMLKTTIKPDPAAFDRSK